MAKVLTDEIRMAHKQPYAGAFLDNCANQAKQGYPQMLAALRTWSIERLRVERELLIGLSLGGMYSQAAGESLQLVRQVVEERKAIIDEILDLQGNDEAGQ